MKKVLIIIAILGITTLFINIASARAEKINNGEMTLVNQNQMDR